MAMSCKKPNLAPSTAYRYHKCRCSRCSDWKREAAARTNNKERARQRAKEWRRNNPERSRANSRRWQANNPDKVLAISLRRYGLTVEEYRAMGDACMICGSKARGMQRGNDRLCVDHDDETGIVRGVLCGACNVGIGHLNHSVDLLSRAIQYLERGNSNANQTRSI